MVLPTRNIIIYGLLAALWALSAAWQIVEHQRVRASARASLVSRAQDTAAALSVVIRSQGRFGLAPRSRIVTALDELVNSTELTSVVLLNAANEVVAAAGAPMDTDIDALMLDREHWEDDYGTFLNIVALGPDADTGELEGLFPSVVMEREDAERRDAPLPLPPGEGWALYWEQMLTEEQRLLLRSFMDNEPITPGRAEEILAIFPEEMVTEERRDNCMRLMVGRPLTEAILSDVMALLRRGQGPWHLRRGRNRPPDESLRRPPWLGEMEYRRLLDARGVHWFIVTMPAHAVRAEIARDIRLRALAAGVALLACLALAWAWGAFSRAAGLQLRLVRTEALAAHLRELNMAAAGLVHETKNPLNIIRGLAQVVSRESATPGSIKKVTEKITEESDRITERLNRFLDYSRPLKPQYTDVSLKDMIVNVMDILDSDRADKELRFQVTAPEMLIKADEDMLRQTLFNLLLNAVQAAPRGSVVEVRAQPPANGTAVLEVYDEGPGVPQEYWEEVFRPYFTTSASGAGLGLAVVRQCAQAHNWEVRYVPSEKGALFRVTGICVSEYKGNRYGGQ